LALNGGIRWVSLNETRNTVNGEKREKEDMRGKTLGRREIFGEGSIIFIWETVLGIFTSGDIGRLYY
jgi:hypothetical protein